LFAEKKEKDMKINSLNSLPIQYKAGFNNVSTDRNKVSFGKTAEEVSIEKKHQKFVSKLDTVVTKAIKERSPDEIAISIKLLKLAESFNEKSNDSDPLNHFRESKKIEIIDLYNVAISNLVGEPFDLWEGNKYGYYIGRTPELEFISIETKVVIKNIEYLKTQLEKGLKLANKGKPDERSEGHHSTGMTSM
jgi:hypothetical protein